MSILLAWTISSAIFGLIHLPTFDCNVAQCLVFIGSARLILSLAYIKTKNIWDSTSARIINDSSFFLFAIFMASLHQQP